MKKRTRKKYKFTPSDFIMSEKVLLRRIQATRTFGSVKKGTTGGYIESEENLSHDGLCWVSGDACVKEQAKVIDDAIVDGKALVRGESTVKNRAKITGDAIIMGQSTISGKAHVTGNVVVRDNARICGRATICGKVDVRNQTRISGDALIS